MEQSPKAPDPAGPDNRPRVPSVNGLRTRRSHNVTLHINPFQLDPALTQAAWHQFTGEAGVVTYFRALTGAEPMGAGNFEVRFHVRPR
jgi:hypothetical protein